jgi:hypothetical protein|tara:strand:+ start:1375 stop:1815 length:441 start_codon:yes stop_codon:yes gene_type:complete
MPERVTREERKISLLIEKARAAKELLSLSLNDNNRSPEEDDMEEVKLKKPKAKEDKPKFKPNIGPASNHAYAGEEILVKKERGYRMDIFDGIFDRLDVVREEINEFKSPVTGKQLAVADKVDSKFDEIVLLLQSVLEEIYSDPLDE